jgi:hypothetical protein
MTFQTSIDKNRLVFFDYIRDPTFGMRRRSSACRWIPDGVLIMATDNGVKSLALGCSDAMTGELRMR